MAANNKKSKGLGNNKAYEGYIPELSYYLTSAYCSKYFGNCFPTGCYCLVNF